MFGQVVLDNSTNIDRKVRFPADTEIADLNGNGTKKPLWIPTSLETCVKVIMPGRNLPNKPNWRQW